MVAAGLPKLKLETMELEILEVDGEVVEQIANGPKDVKYEVFL